MVKYAIYKYVFSKLAEGKGLFDGKENTVYNKAQDFLSELLGAKTLNMYKPKQDGMPVIYPNDIFCARQGVVVMRVCNVKTFTFYKDYQETKGESNPWSNVIIDNRQGVCQLAIEQSGAFGSDTNKVRDLLSETFNQHLSKYGMHIEIMIKMRTAKFWDVINEQCCKNKDRINRVVFDFPNPKETKPIDTSEKMIDRLEFYSSLISSMGAAKSSMIFDAQKNLSINLDQTREDIAQMVTLCCNNGYGISVHFSQMGVYRCDDRIRAIYQMSDNVVENFINGQTVMEEGKIGNSFALIQWLDNIREITKDCENAKPTPKRRKKSGKNTMQNKSAV